MVDGVEVFQREDLTRAFGQIADAVQGVAGALFHAGGESADVGDWNAHVAQAGAVQVQPVDPKALADLGGFSLAEASSISQPSASVRRP